MSEQKIFLDISEIFPDFIEIFNQDIEDVTPKIYKDINYKCTKMGVRLSEKSLRNLLDEGYPILFNNYKSALTCIQSGKLLRANSTTKKISIPLRINLKSCLINLLINWFFKPKRIREFPCIIW